MTDESRDSDDDSDPGPDEPTAVSRRRALLGLGGAYALFPFGGNLVRAGRIAVLLVALARTGDPRRCEWN